jgi:2-polyprenyl-3-methyl-5-hydroxy-6-metoxy-1,4-benzoquinol methylase
MKPEAAPAPNPSLIFETLTAFHRSAALEGAIKLDLFTAIAAGHSSAGEIAQQCKAAERGVRILCDFLVAAGFLTKNGNQYGLTPSSAMFLDRRSPAYLGGMAGFLMHPEHRRTFDDVAENVRRGGTAMPDAGFAKVESEIWVAFARSMAGLMMPAAQRIAEVSGAADGRAIEVLDVAAGHGAFGITIAQRNPNARITALDGPAVLEVARQRAGQAGVADRYRTIAGDFFTVALSGPYDFVLLTNFLHHFDREACVRIAKKAKAALKPGGKAVMLEFVPDEDRVSPQIPAMFALVMLANTPAGDAYTFSELAGICREAGFSETTRHEVMPGNPQTILISR